MAETLRAAMPGVRTLLELLQQQADRCGDEVVFRFCPDGDEETSRLTYRELDRKARAIASDLQQYGAAGERVLIFCHPGLDSIAGFFGCFYAGAVVVPVDEHWASPRAETVLPDARAKFALATEKTRERIGTSVAARVDGPLQWCSLDETGGDADAWMMPRVDADTVAVVQYTSGSTAAPKGVVLTHRNYLHNLEAGRMAWNPAADNPVFDSPVTGVSWLPHFHDMGFVGGVLGVIYSGGTGVLMSPSSFFRRPIRWLQAMSRYQAAISAAPNLGYHLAVKGSSPEERAALDLSNWSIAVNGGDPINAATLRNFAEAFAPAGFRPEAFRPAYGLAEATLGVSGMSTSPVPVVRHIDRVALGEDRVVDAPPDDAGAAAVVSCGRPQGGQDVVIVDPDTRLRCGAGEVGEIWIAGPSVAQGYWRRPEETERVFSAYLADTDQGPFLRTGDLGFLDAGELFVTGRCQDLVTIAGIHYYPNDIELTVQDCDPELLLPGRGAVFAVKPRWNAAERLIVVQEVHRHRVGDVDLAGVIDTIRSAITEHHRIDAHAVLLVKPMRIPTTTSGKIRRSACRQEYLDHQIQAVAQWRAPVPRSGMDKEQIKVGLARLVGGMLVRRHWDPPQAPV